MNYLTKFDDSGKRITSYPMDGTIGEERYKELINDGYVEISEEDWNYYVGNMGAGENGTGYIRGADGKPTDAPAYVPSVEEQLAQLDAQYNAEKANILTAYQTAMLYGDTDTMESLKADLTALDEQYDEDYERIVGGE
jgi:hypothetical protein